MRSLLHVSLKLKRAETGMKSGFCRNVLAVSFRRVYSSLHARRSRAMSLEEACK